MTKPLTVALVTPFSYQPFKSISSLCDVITRELTAAEIEVVQVIPSSFFADLLKQFPKAHQIIGSIERLTFAPMFLRAKLFSLQRKAQNAKRDFIVLLSDQSLAIMGRALSDFKFANFVSDLIMLRKAMGEFGGTSSYGTKFNQRATLAGLMCSSAFITPSQATATDLANFVSDSASHTVVASLPLNAEYKQLPTEELAPRLNQLWRQKGVLPPSYILNTGTAAWYKNRLGIIHLCGELKKLSPTVPALVFAGEQPTDEEALLIKKYSLSFYHFENLSTTDLNTLYCGAECYLAPSFAEGFGWTALEAIACGTPLVISDTPALVENFEPAAALILPTPETDQVAQWAAEFAPDLLKLIGISPQARAAVAQQALSHSVVFSPERFRELLIRALRLCA